MLNKKLMMLTIFIISLLAVSAVSAAENATDDAVCVEDTNDDVSAISAADDAAGEDIIGEEHGDEAENDSFVIALNEEESDNLTGNSLSFTDLAIKIANAEGDVYLTNDYVYRDSDSAYVNGIEIKNKQITIHGNGVTLDGKNAARIFKVYKSDVVFRDIVFVNGKTNENGGAIYHDHYADKGEVTAINCTFIGNFADYSGGALIDVLAVNCTFKNNTANMGGAMYGGSALNCSFIGNLACSNGGALSDCNALNCDFNNNSALVNGGAMDIFQNYTVKNCTFTDNSAEYSGGGIYAYTTGGARSLNMKLNVENCTFTNNSAQSGGGIFSQHINLKVENCTFTDNSAEYSGGGIYANSLDINPQTYIHNEYYADVINSNFTENQGMAIYSDASISSNGTNRFKAVGCIFDNNSANPQEVYQVNLSNCIFKKTVLSASKITAIYGISKNIVVTLKDSAGNVLKSKKIKVKVGSLSKTLTTNSKGQISVDVSMVTPKTYTATFSFAGDGIHHKSTTTQKVKISKAASRIITSSKAFYAKSTKKVTATLKDTKNRIIKNRYVTFKVAGKTYKVKTNSRGIATATVKIAKKGSFSTAVSFAGDKYYNKCSKAIKITVK